MVCSVCGQESFEFQFTPLREGRPQVQREWGDAKYFNSRPCERGDADIAAIKADKVTISIHAPARGATARKNRKRRNPNYFNSRPCERGDLAVSAAKSIVVVFQFTPLREGRHPVTANIPAGTEFQFTPLREGRPAPKRQRNGLVNFNSRPCERGDGKIKQN